MLMLDVIAVAVDVAVAVVIIVAAVVVVVVAAAAAAAVVVVVVVIIVFDAVGLWRQSWPIFTPVPSKQGVQRTTIQR